MSTLETRLYTRKEFMKSQSCRALHAACMTEKHARRFYLQAARRMEEDGLYVIAHALRFTAAQEKEHADIFCGLLTAFGGSCLPTAEDAPVILPDDPITLLRSAAQDEHEEWDQLYPAGARIADQEGYPRIAGAFRRIAETEQTHALRFLQYAKALAEGTLFHASRRISWLCLPCGQLHTGTEAPAACSSCGRDQGHFIRSSFYPFVLER